MIIIVTQVHDCASSAAVTQQSRTCRAGFSRCVPAERNDVPEPAPATRGAGSVQCATPLWNVWTAPCAFFYLLNMTEFSINLMMLLHDYLYPPSFASTLWMEVATTG